MRHLYHLFTVIFVMISAISFAQLSCGDTFSDTGGEFFEYGNNEDILYTICPLESGSAVTLTFDFVDIAVNETGFGTSHGCWDYLSIYNGPDSTYFPLARVLCGEVSQSGQSPAYPNSLLVEGDSFTSTHASGCMAVRFLSDDIITEDGWSATVTCSDPCEGLDTAPVGLTKSFQPVPFPSGVVDRVQVKWYKELPNVKYPASQNVAADIEFWPIRDLVSNTPITDGDTTLLADKTKPGKDFFKWPIKFNRPDIDPNVRYAWRVRVKCQTGSGIVSPWSEVRIFNTPDFDPETGILGIPAPVDAGAKYLTDEPLLLKIYPNPGTAHETVVSIGGDEEALHHVRIYDAQGRVVYMEVLPIKGLYTLSLADKVLGPGLYFVQVQVSDRSRTERIVLR